jgi:hypothetical protein
MTGPPGTLPAVVRIGGVSKSELLAALERAGVRLNPLALELFAHAGFATAAAPSTIAVAAVAVGELGHARGATLAQVFERAAERGLALCPLELAAHLRLQFADQPEGADGHPPSSHRAPPGSLTVAARPLAQDGGLALGFYLRRIRGVPWLRGYRAPADHRWDAGDRFVFCRPDATAQEAFSESRGSPR